MNVFDYRESFRKEIQNEEEKQEELKVKQRFLKENEHEIRKQVKLWTDLQVTNIHTKTHAICLSNFSLFLLSRSLIFFSLFRKKNLKRERERDGGENVSMTENSDTF